MPSLSGRGHGDLHVKVNVIVPDKLTSEQKRLLREFEASGGKEGGKARWSP
jgi:molecular chaperone DnaJ